MIVNFKINSMHRNPLGYFAGLCLAMLLAASCNQPDYQVIIRNGLIYDGNGGEPYKADIGIKDRKSTRLNSSHVKRSRMPSSA